MYFARMALTRTAPCDYLQVTQSVYPFLEDGTFDQVFLTTRLSSGKMTQAEYKRLTIQNYQTDVCKINITDNTMEFLFNGQSKRNILTYVSVRKF